MSEEDTDDSWRGDLPPAGAIPLLTRTGDRIEFDDLVKIDADNLVSSFERQAAWAGFFNYQSFLANARVDRKTRQLKELEGELYLHYRNSGSTKKLTVDEIKASVFSDVKMRQLYDELYALKREQAAWDAAKWAWSDRKDMLVQLGADKRADQKNF